VLPPQSIDPDSGLSQNRIYWLDFICHGRDVFGQQTSCAPQGKKRMNNDGALLRGSGLLCFGIALFALAYGYSVDIGVSVNVPVSGGNLGRVANLGLMHKQAMVLQLALGFMVAGAVLFAGGCICRAAAPSGHDLRLHSAIMPPPSLVAGRASPQPVKFASPEAAQITDPPPSSPARPIGEMGYCPSCSQLRSTTSDKCVFCGSTAPATNLPSRRV
jgi:hypothetical protein